jgi:hypothetical protein
MITFEFPFMNKGKWHHAIIDVEDGGTLWFYVDDKNKMVDQDKVTVHETPQPETGGHTGSLLGGGDAPIVPAPLDNLFGPDGI